MSSFPPGPNRRRKLKRVEQPLQIALVDFHRLAVINPRDAILLAIPNGEARDKITAGILVGKRPKGTPLQPLSDDELIKPYGLGVLPGATDLLLVTRGITDWVEVKVPEDQTAGTKKTSLSRPQKVFAKALTDLDHYHHVVRTIDEYEALLRRRGIALRIVDRFASGAWRIRPM